MCGNVSHNNILFVDSELFLLASLLAHNLQLINQYTLRCREFRSYHS